MFGEPGVEKVVRIESVKNGWVVTVHEERKPPPPPPQEQENEGQWVDDDDQVRKEVLEKLSSVIDHQARQPTTVKRVFRQTEDGLRQLAHFIFQTLQEDKEGLKVKFYTC